MLIGYARTSTLEQKAGLEAQRELLTALGCERMWGGANKLSRTQGVSQGRYRAL